MSWFPVDDAAHSHPKMRRAGLEAIGLWTVCGSFCMAYLTDGFVPEWFVKQHPRGMALAKRLVDASLWRAGINGEDNGWWFHDWKTECTKERIEEARANARARKQKSRESRTHGADDVTRDRTRDSPVSSRGCLGPTQPNPTQPINNLVDLGGELTQVGEEPPVCRRHPNGTETPCGVCQRRRIWVQAADTAREGDELRKKRRARLAADNCPDCHGTNVIEVGDNAARKCNHPNVELANA